MKLTLTILTKWSFTSVEVGYSQLIHYNVYGHLQVPERMAVSAIIIHVLVAM
jgi:hypothetical protein